MSQVNIIMFCSFFALGYYDTTWGFYHEATTDKLRQPKHSCGGTAPCKCASGCSPVKRGVGCWRCRFEGSTGQKTDVGIEVILSSGFWKLVARISLKMAVQIPKVQLPSSRRRSNTKSAEVMNCGNAWPLALKALGSWTMMFIGR